MKGEEKSKEEIIEELEKLKNERRRKENRMYDVIKQMPYQVFRYKLTNEGEYVLTLSEGKLAEKHNLTTSEVVGKTVKEVLGENACNQCLEYYDKAFSGEIVEFEVEFEKNWYLTVLVPLETEEDGTVTEVVGTAQDITDRRRAEKMLSRQNRCLKRNQKKLKRSFVELAETASRVLGVRNPYTQKHQKKVALISREVGKKLGLNDERTMGLYIGGLLHDIGKINVPSSILTKTGELTDREWELIKSHPKVGYNQILEDTSFPWPVAEMALHHHERLDGSGYPEGLEGNELSPEVRILSAVDAVEAMSANRPYRNAKPMEEVLEEMETKKGEKFDSEVVNVLTNIIQNGSNERNAKEVMAIQS